MGHERFKRNGVKEESWLFNSAVMIGGVLNFLFLAGLRVYVGEARLAGAGVALMMLSSVFLALVGIFTLDYFVMHAVVALVHFILAPLGFLLVGFEPRTNGDISPATFFLFSRRRNTFSSEDENCQ